MRYVWLLLLLVGCSGFNAGGAPDVTDDDFRTGTGALSLNFQNNAPEKELYANQETSAVLTLENTGAHDITQGTLFIAVDDSAFTLVEQTGKRTFSVEGKSATFPRGGSQIVSFPLRVNELPAQSQAREEYVIATACYDYETLVFETVCIDGDPYNQFENNVAKPCSLRDLSPGARGGPVGVTSVKVRMNQDDQFFYPTFIITIKKLTQQGFVYAPGKSAQFCGADTLRDEIANQIKFSATLSDYPLTCDTELVQLEKGEGTVQCSGDFVRNQAQFTYEAPLSMYLEYGHSTSVSKQVVIRR